MIVTPGDRAPEGLAAFRVKGRAYLAIANETVAPGATASHTTLYRLDIGNGRGGTDGDGGKDGRGRDDN